MEVKIIIDGKPFVADSNETILSVARKNGVEIPTLCFLKNLNEPASCRICVVEVEGARNLVTACSTKIKDGMVVKTIWYVIIMLTAIIFNDSIGIWILATIVWYNSVFNKKK